MKNRLVILICVWCCLLTDAQALPEVIDNSVYPENSRPTSNVNIAASPSTNTLIEMTGRLEQLQLEVQQLTGKVEEQANQIAELKKRQSSMYTDFEDRFQGIENKAAGTEQAPTEGTETPAASPEATGKPIDAETTPSPESAPAPEASAESAPASPVAPVAKTENPQVSGLEKEEYQHAYLALRTGHTTDSIAEFSAYLEKYPNGGLANNAQYWLGEAHRANHDNESAKKAFNDVIEKYPGGAKVPDALLKLGYIEMDQKDNDKAREHFNRILNEFPNSPPALLASKKLLQLNTSN